MQKKTVEVCGEKKTGHLPKDNSILKGPRAEWRCVQFRLLPSNARAHRFKRHPVGRNNVIALQPYKNGMRVVAGNIINLARSIHFPHVAK